MKFEKAEGFDNTIVDTDSSGVYFDGESAFQFDWARNRRISPTSYGAFGSDACQVRRCYGIWLEKAKEAWLEMMA